MRFAAILSLVLAIGGAAHAQDDQLHSDAVLNTGGVACGSGASAYTPTAVTWTNSKGYAIRIVRSWGWVGLDPDRTADLGFAIYRSSDLNVVYSYPMLDRYANPNGPTAFPFDLAPGVVLASGASLLIHYYCAKFGTSAAVNSHFAGTIFWVHEP